jgi:hypothetical protein
MAIDIKKPIKNLVPYLLKAREENLNEADTIQRVIVVFTQVLGYDAMTEITLEQQIKCKYVDMAIKIDNTVRLLVEAKSAGTTLRDRHIEQAEGYASKGNIRWVLLTNGVEWILYHLSFEEGIESERVFALDLSSDDIDRAAEMLGLLHRQSIRGGNLETFWERQVALNPESIAKALFMEETLHLIRRYIKKSEGILINEEDLANAIQNMFSTEAREQIGPMKIRRKQQKTKTEKKLKVNYPWRKPSQNLTEERLLEIRFDSW